MIIMTHVTIADMIDATLHEQLHAYGFHLAICAFPEIKILLSPIRDIFVKPRDTATDKYVDTDELPSEADYERIRKLRKDIYI